MADTEAREIAKLKVEIQVLTELILAYQQNIVVSNPTHTSGSTTHTVKLFTQAQINNKRTEIMNRDATKRMFLGIGRDGPADEAELSEMYHEIDNNLPNKDNFNTLLNTWYQQAQTGSTATD